MEKYYKSRGFQRVPWRLVLLAVSLCLISVHTLGQGSKTDPKLRHIRHFVVIYQENWSFDSLYGLFPGANDTAASDQRRGN
jgi:phospholipase C